MKAYSLPVPSCARLKPSKEGGGAGCSAVLGAVHVWGCLLLMADKFPHVRALVASLHAPKNVARPPIDSTESASPQTADISSEEIPSEGTEENVSDAATEAAPDVPRLPVLQEEASPHGSHSPSCSSLGEEEAPVTFSIGPPTRTSPHDLQSFSSSSSSSLPATFSPRRRASHDITESASSPFIEEHISEVEGSKKEASPKRMKSNSICAGNTELGRRRKGAPFLHLHLAGLGGGEGPYSAAPHFHIPTFTITAPAESASRRLSSALHGLGAFTLRRHSNTSLHRAESMVSLCFRSLSNLIAEDNLGALQAFLSNKQVVVDDRDENGTTALMVACSQGRPSMVSELLVHGADPNAEDADGWSSLLLAAKLGRTSICTQLLDHGANVHHREMGGWTALMWAAYKGYEECLALLLERGADVNAHGNYHISSLVWAAGRGYSGIVERLLGAGARPNAGDKYGTTALVWAARRGSAPCVRALLGAGAAPDQAGMYSWTALLQATQGNHIEIVHMLLEHKPNVNALDKDGCSALTLACKEGYYEIAAALLNSGAYINIQDRGGDTCLIHAVKGGHKPVVEALLKKYADVDVLGKDRKTAVYTAVEKGHVGILKLLLNSNPDLELSTKDGDTALLRAVRSRNAEMVQLLLDKKAKVNAADKKGDTCLHIAMRARSKAIVEILLRNPKHSQLLYRPNRSQETPYNIDMNYPKTILGQIFGARRLNTNDDNESLLGYELYSSALADMLSEPSLSMPITVGLYARWGSGKSFLLSKLREEMKNFAREWLELGWQWGWVVGWGVWHVALLGGALASMCGAPASLALSIGALLFVLIYVTLLVLWYASQKYEWSWPYTVMLALSQKLNSLKLVLQVVFCHPPGPQCSHMLPSQPVRFHFTDQAKSSTQEGEASVIQMVVSLTEALENQYGRMCTRLYRAFRPKPIRATADWRWRRVCCVPHILAFEICFLFAVLGLCILVIYLTSANLDDQKAQILEGVLMGIAAFISLAAVANLYTCGRIITALLLSPRSHIKRSVDKQPEGFLQALRPEVTLLTDMVKCLDAFTGQQTRLVVVVDALDSCEQDRVLIVLNAIHTLCSDQHSPFIIILAIDPHIISKAVEVNSRRAFSESNIGGWDYLRNLVELPFYLQNSALRRVKTAQQTSQKKQLLSVNDDMPSSLQRSVSARRLSSASELMSSQEKLKGLGASGSSSRGARKLKMSESVASSMNSNLHRVGLTSGPADLNKVLLTDDYFSDVTPRSMRRLMNVLYITGRLLKAFQIEFNWYHLASWVNLTEQWPFRTSWIILHHEMFEEHIEDSTSLKHIYDKIRPNIPILREAEPLMDLDRDERKLDVFLGFHRNSLSAADLKIFLPFTINLDPYIKKVIKDEQQHFHIDNEPIMMNPVAQKSHNPKFFNNRKQARPPSLPPIYGGGTPAAAAAASWPTWQEAPTPSSLTYSFTNLHQGELCDMRLSRLGTSSLCSLLERELPHAAANISALLRTHNITGRVLSHCELPELKQVLCLNFGDWELFKLLILGLREMESKMPPSTANMMTTQEKERPEKEPKPRSSHETSKSKPSNMEKQVTLEEQMICGALQTLNEEALEDVLQGEPAGPPVSDEHESLQLVLLTPGGGWQASTPPASPQLPRKAEPILKGRGSFKHSSKKHVSIHDKGFTYGSSSSLKNMELIPIIVKIEDETTKNPVEEITYTSQQMLNVERAFPPVNSQNMNPDVKLYVDDNRDFPVDLGEQKTSESSQANIELGSGDKHVSTLPVESRIEYIKMPAEKNPGPDNQSAKGEKRHVKSSRKRPSSLLFSECDPCPITGKQLSTRSRSAEDSTCPTENPSSTDSTTNPSLTSEGAAQAASVELITRLKDRLFHRSSSIDRNSRNGELESDDESTPLVSSERSSPSISLKAHRNLTLKDGKVQSSQHPPSPRAPSSHSSSPHSSKDNSPVKLMRKHKHERVAKKTFSPEKHDCNVSDGTISIEFSPCSDHSSSDSHIFNPMEDGKCNVDFNDTFPAADEVIFKEFKLSNFDRPASTSYSTRSDSVQSFSHLLEPHQAEALSRGASDISLRSACLWRQDAVEDQEDWTSPESSV